MSKYTDKAKQLRAMTVPHYNCAQAVIVPFAEDLDIDEELLMRMAANFGGGMRMASVCGSITGAAMVLGLFGMNDTAKLNEYYRRMKENHGGYVTCADLLKRSNEMGIPRREHCDGIIYESIGVVEDILRSEGLLPAE